MKTYISLENELSEQFENVLNEFDFLDQVSQVRERDFMTDYIFEDITEEEEETLETLKNELN